MPYQNYLNRIKSPVLLPPCVVNPSSFYKQSSEDYVQRLKKSFSRDNSWLKDEVKNERSIKFYSYPKFDATKTRLPTNVSVVSFPAELPIAPQDFPQQQNQWRPSLNYTQAPYAHTPYAQVQQQQQLYAQAPPLQQPYTPQQSPYTQVAPQRQQPQLMYTQVQQPPPYAQVQPPLGLNGLDIYSKKHDSVKAFFSRHASIPNRDAEYMKCFYVLYGMGFSMEEKIVPIIARYGPDHNAVIKEFERRFPK